MKKYLELLWTLKIKNLRELRSEGEPSARSLRLKK